MGRPDEPGTRNVVPASYFGFDWPLRSVLPNPVNQEVEIRITRHEDDLPQMAAVPVKQVYGVNSDFDVEISAANFLPHLPGIVRSDVSFTDDDTMRRKALSSLAQWRIVLLDFPGHNPIEVDHSTSLERLEVLAEQKVIDPDTFLPDRETYVLPIHKDCDPGALVVFR